MALTKQDLELIKQALAPQFKKIEKTIEKNRIEAKQDVKNLKVHTTEQLKKLKAKFQ